MSGDHFAVLGRIGHRHRHRIKHWMRCRTFAAHSMSRVAAHVGIGSNVRLASHPKTKADAD
ncbi:hypothetical protein [Bifidobacterium avesanii]|uniref:Uncharacterized protein n=1 Tax=Bifidobacterium avesanii TaxID=1798157 RepID=A0A7K3TJI2_9BIFI|nr:hypothetical protein [Bifidobacterium avesanii]NEG78879.1 hypothetical protein [Bifidobacterium avesanii]